GRHPCLSAVASFIAPARLPAATRQPGMAVLLCRVVEQASLPVMCRQASLPVGGPFIATGKMPAATRQPGMAVLLCGVVEQASLPVMCRQASLPVGGCFLHCAGQDARRDATASDGCPTLPRGRTGILACYVPAGILACRRSLHCAGQDARRDATARDGCPTLPRGCPTVS